MLKGAKIKLVKIEEEDEELELQSIWPLLSKVLNWLLRNQFDKAVKVSK
jgi:hypothetical protein